MMRSKTWQERRAALNHGELGNGLLMATGSQLALISGQAVDEDRLKDFALRQLPAWEPLRVRILELVDAFEVEMSPCTLLQHESVVFSNTGIADWANDVVHTLWLKRYSVEDSVGAARNGLSLADLAYERLVSKLKVSGEYEEISTWIDAESELKIFDTACRKLSGALSSFPSKVLVA